MTDRVKSHPVNPVKNPLFDVWQNNRVLINWAIGAGLIRFPGRRPDTNVANREYHRSYNRNHSAANRARGLTAHGRPRRNKPSGIRTSQTEAPRQYHRMYMRLWRARREAQPLTTDH